MPIQKIKFLLAVYLIISCLCLLFYLNTLNNPFIWDDEALIIKNTLIKNWHFWYKAFTNDLFLGIGGGSNFYRPIQTLSYMWDYYFWELDPRGYHVTNIILHTFVSFLVFLLIHTLTKEERIISFTCAILFALTPIHTEAVTYISGRAEMFLGIFLISSLLLFIRSQNSYGRSKIICLYFSLILFVLGLLSKELAVVFPLIILAYVFYYAKDNLKKSGYFFKSILPFFIIDYLYLILRLSILKFSTTGLPSLAEIPFAIRVSVLPRVIFTYIKLLILPINLHMSREVIRSITFVGIYISWMLIFIISLTCFYFLKYKEKTKISSFMLFWSLLFFLPQSGIFPINAFVAEHFIYLSSISFFMLASSLLLKHLRKRLFIFSIISLVLYYGLLTLSRNYEWHSPIIFYERIIKFSPASHQAHNNLGLQYEYKGLYDKAISEYKKALVIKPDLLEAHSNLANVYYNQGRFKEAEREYEIVESIVTYDQAGGVQNNIGCLYEVQGLLDKALERYKLALRLDPTIYFVHFNIARIYLAKGDINSANRKIVYSLP